MKTVYKMYTADDIDALVQFWNENAGWDEIDRTEWERRFCHTPFGPSSVVLAVKENSDEIQGQIVFIPTEINVDGRVVNARRPYAVVLKSSLRQGLRLLSMMEIVIKMYNHATARFKASGVGLIHMMPDPGWARAFKFLPNTQTDSFLLWSLALPMQQPFAMSEEYTVRAISSTNEAIDGLSEKNNRLYGCSFPRNTKTLSWKMSHATYQAFGVFRKGELVGVSTSQIKEKDKQWLICDVLAADNGESLRATLKAACNAARQYTTTNETSVHKVAILVTPLLEKAVQDIGFQKDNYKFPMVVQILDQTISKQQVAPERWYASAND